MSTTQTVPEKLYLSILNSEYEVNLPTSGEEIDIAILIQQISRERYESFKLSAFPNFIREAVKIEAIAFFKILIPKLQQNLTVKSLMDLKRKEMDVLIETYIEQFLPWWEQWQTIFNAPKESVEEKKSE